MEESKEVVPQQRPRISSNSNVQSTMDELNRHTVKLARHRRLWTIYTIVLILVIPSIWIGLTCPFAISVISRPSLANRTRPNVTALNTLTSNSSLLPQKCTSKNTTSTSVISCPDDYMFNCTMCVPICGLWHPSGKGYFIGYRVVTVSVALVDFIFSVIGLIILLKVPGTFRFPQINYLFMFINAVVFSLCLTVLALPGPYYSFCGSRAEDYAVVAQTPSAYVTIMGMITSNTSFSFNLWFLCVTVNVFLVVYFPSWKIMQSRKYKIVLFVIESVVAFGIPLLFSVVYLSIYKRYSFLRLPQLPYAVSWAVFVPLIMSTAMALTFVSLILYKLQVQKSIVLAGQQKIQLKGYEIRMIVLAIALGIVVFIAFLNASLVLRNSVIYQFYLEEFWSCLTLKTNYHLFQVSNLTCSTEYNAYYLPLLHYAGNICVGAWSVLLLTVLTTKETRETWSGVFKKLCHRVPFTSLVLTNNTGSVKRGSGPVI